MILKVWINAFIPKTVSGYTEVIKKGSYSGKSAVPLPGLARLNPFNLFKDWDTGYLTDLLRISILVVRRIHPPSF